MQEAEIQETRPVYTPSQSQHAEPEQTKAKCGDDEAGYKQDDFHDAM